MTSLRHTRRVGLPIGNLTSQPFANFFMSAVDHRAKDRLRVRPYLRYMDDILLFGDDHAQLVALGQQLQASCERDRLRLHPWQVMPTRRGITWLGFRILPDHTRIKRTSVRRAQRRLAELADAARRDPSQRDALLASVRATFAHWKHADSWRLRRETLRELGLLEEELQTHEEGR